MPAKSDFQDGWEFSVKIMGVNFGSYMGENYVNAVEDAIKQLEDNINNHSYRNLEINKLQGFMQEEWHTGSFNVDAVASGSEYRAEAIHSTLKNSVDIQITRQGEVVADYSAKSYADGAKSAVQQALLNPETRRARYEGQDRLVPMDQLSDAKSEAHHRALNNQEKRPDVSEAYAETEQKLTDKLTSDDGTSSKPANRKDYERMASKSKSQTYSAKDDGVTVKDAIKSDYLLKQAFKAGYTTAAITVALQLAPEIFKAIDYLIKQGELNIDDLRESGKKGISAGAIGFIRGSIASSFMIMCQSGKLGETLKSCSPGTLGLIVSLVMQTVENCILVALGKMTPRQMGDAFADMVVMSSGHILGGIIGQAIAPALPVIGYMLGSLVGASCCVVYNIVKKKLISFCVDTGFTCFGLVEQNYELPEELLNEHGVETISIPLIQIETVEISRASIDIVKIERTEYETIHFTVLRRGVIGVNKVGYVFC